MKPENRRVAALEHCYAHNRWNTIIQQPGPEVIKLFSCSTQLSMKILVLISMKTIKKFSFFLDSDNAKMLFFPLINVKMPTIVGILTFMSGKNFIPVLS